MDFILIAKEIDLIAEPWMTDGLSACVIRLVVVCRVSSFFRFLFGSRVESVRPETTESKSMQMKMKT